MNPAVFVVMWSFCVHAYKVCQVQRVLKVLSEITWNILAERNGAVVWLEPKAEPKATVSIPFVKEVSERIKRIFAKRGTQVYFRSLEQHQAKEGPRDNKVVIYQIPCLDCDKSYIGETLKPGSRTIRGAARMGRCRDQAGTAQCRGWLPDWLEWEYGDRSREEVLQKKSERCLVHAQVTNFN